MANEKTSKRKTVSFDPDVCHDIISAAEHYGMSTERVILQLLSYILEGKKKIEEPDITPMISKNQ